MTNAKYKFDAIIFDFDGVLVDSVDVKTKAFTSLYAHYGDEVVKSVSDYHLKNGGLSRFEKFRYFHNVILKKQLTLEDEISLAKCFENIVLTKVIQSSWCNGAKEFLDKFYMQINLFVASGTPEIELKKIIEQRHMSQYFRSIHGSPETKVHNIKKILSNNKKIPKKTLMIGDSINDYESAMETNINFVGFTTKPSHPFPENIKVIESVLELQNILRE